MNIPSFSSIIKNEPHINAEQCFYMSKVFFSSILSKLDIALRRCH